MVVATAVEELVGATAVVLPGAVAVVVVVVVVVVACSVAVAIVADAAAYVVDTAIDILHTCCLVFDSLVTLCAHSHMDLFHL